MTRLDLIHEEAIVAASLLELCGSRLIIRASSMVQSAAATQGRADTLDYFALLIGQLLGCDCLDFGLSRPHLDNGSFRYKSKWCTQLSPAGGFKADICILPQRDNDATRSFLRRNHFLQWDGTRYFVRVLADANEPTSKLSRRARAAGVFAVEMTENPADAGMVAR